jgi:hypothetical protein
MSAFMIILEDSYKIIGHYCQFHVYEHTMNKSRYTWVKWTYPSYTEIF